MWSSTCLISVVDEIMASSRNQSQWLAPSDCRHCGACHCRIWRVGKPFCGRPGYHIISYHVISYHIMSYHIISCHICNSASGTLELFYHLHSSPPAGFGHLPGPAQALPCHGQWYQSLQHSDLAPGRGHRIENFEICWTYRHIFI